MPEPSRVYYFNTVTLSNFALAHRLDLLVKRYGKRLCVTPEVLDEITEGIVCGYAPLADVEAACLSGDITASGPLQKSERSTYRKWLPSLAPGEASCLAAAKGKKAVVVTDDRHARECCTEEGVPFTGTIGILKACCLDRTLSPPDADAILQSMIAAGYHSPVRSISDLL